ncbi:hypothetical protein ES703_120581 [subsurface metagenome]
MAPLVVAVKRNFTVNNIVSVPPSDIGVPPPTNLLTPILVLLHAAAKFMAVLCSSMRK